jgi:hypothetical protein
LTERPDGQLQPPLQDCTESFYNKAVSGRLLHWLPDGYTSAAQNYHNKAWSIGTLKANVQTVELVHAISIYEA